MGLNIKNPEVELLAAQVARLAGETKTEAIRKALEERKARLKLKDGSRAGSLRSFLEKEVWPHVPRDVLGRRLTKQEEEDLLGFGEDGT